MGRRAWVLLLALTASEVRAAEGPAAPHRQVEFRKWPYLGDVNAVGAHILFELAAPAPATITVSRPGAAPLALTSADALSHEIAVTGLAPGTRHRYRVEAGGAVAEGDITTAPPPGEDAPFTFVLFGDSRDDNVAHRTLLDRILAEAPDFVVSTGDLVDGGSFNQQWQSFFDVEGPLLASTPFYPALGNHDYASGGKTDQYRKLFALPEAGPDGEAYYRFDWGASRFIVLDSNVANEFGATQTQWLERELQAARQSSDVRHVFAVMHHPVYSISVHGGDEVLQRVWAPLFARYKVDAVFSGHDHVYQRLTKDGVLYMVSGGGGASLYERGVGTGKADRAASVYFERVHHYVRVQVRGDAVEMSAVRDDGSLIETVRIGGVGATRRALPVPAAAAALPAELPHEIEAAPAKVVSRRKGCDVAAGGRTSNALILLGMVAAVAVIVAARRGRHKA